MIIYLGDPKVFLSYCTVYRNHENLCTYIYLAFLGISEQDLLSYLLDVCIKHINCISFFLLFSCI